MSAVATSSDIHPLLQSYLRNLATRPLTTKSTTLGFLSFLQEILASHIAGVPFPVSKRAPAYQHALAAAKINSTALKMAIYGAFVSAPLSHVLVGTLQKFFAGKTSPGARVAQVLASNLLVAPIQTVVYLASMAVINGAKSTEEIKRTVKAGFFQVIKVTWLVSPIALVIAQRFLRPELWVPFFNLVSFVLGTLANAKVKKLRMAAAKAKADKEAKGQ